MNISGVLHFLSSSQKCIISHLDYHLYTPNTSLIPQCFSDKFQTPSHDLYHHNNHGLIMSLFLRCSWYILYVDRVVLQPVCKLQQSCMPYTEHGSQKVNGLYHQSFPNMACFCHVLAVPPCFISWQC